MKRFWAVGLITGVLATLTGVGCHEEPAGRPADKITVAVSILPQAWLVKKIGGQHVEVLTLMQPGGQAETYQPTDAMVGQVANASVYFRIGVPFENGPWFEALQASTQLTIVDTRQGIPLRRLTRHLHESETTDPHTDWDQAHGGEDPHIWLCPRLLKLQASTVADALGRLDPLHEPQYQANLRALEAELDALDGDVRQRLEPFRGRTILVFHPAWGYFAHEYGLRQIAIELEGKDPTDHELTRLQQLARRERIAVVFVQPQFSGRSARAVAGAIGARLEQLDPLAPDVPANMVRVAQAMARSLR